jgi:hypothetical protein
MDCLKMEKYELYINLYIESIWFLLDFVKNMDIVPPKLIFKLSLITKDYVFSKREELLEKGIKYLIPNKKKLLKLTVKNIDMNEVEDIYNSLQHDNENINLLFTIIRNSSKLSKKNEELIKSNFEIILDILDKIYKLI